MGTHAYVSYTYGPHAVLFEHIRRGLWVLKIRLKSVVRELEFRLRKQLKIRQKSAKMES